ncbi:uncharacterized protein LOC100200603 [Hydra vulgaris]|uniref:Uncharacterized protein LOC100200603 n=1 Tax=Hydra vulgaris TaxID=6087 RepID=A0ABM4DAL6_HYDVU
MTSKTTEKGGFMGFLCRQNVRCKNLPFSAKLHIFRESNQLKTQSVPNYLCSKATKLYNTPSHYVLPHFPVKPARNQSLPIDVAATNTKILLNNESTVPIVAKEEREYKLHRCKKMYNICIKNDDLTPNKPENVLPEDNVLLSRK